MCIRAGRLKNVELTIRRQGHMGIWAKLTAWASDEKGASMVEYAC